MSKTTIPDTRGLPDKVWPLLDRIKRNFYYWPTTFNTCSVCEKDWARGSGPCVECTIKELVKLGCNLEDVKNYVKACENDQKAWGKVMDSVRSKEEEKEQPEYFKSDKELMTFLLAGGKITSEDYEEEGGYLYLTEEGYITDESNMNTYSLNDLYIATEYFPYKEPEEIHWYNNIPDCGILCWCGDSLEQVESKLEHRHPDFVLNYILENEYPFKDLDGVEWKYAQPLTKEELLQFYVGDN